MNTTHLSDSYDFAKRTLLSAAPEGERFLAVPMSTDTPTEEKLTSYRTLLDVDTDPELLLTPTGPRTQWVNRVRASLGGRKRVFLDPDIGVRAYRAKNAGAYVFFEDIQRLLARANETLLICYDQSLSRGGEKLDREEKMGGLNKPGVSSMYFCSHVSFLIASNRPHLITEWRQQMLDAGIWHKRFEGPLQPKPPLPE